MQSVIGFGVTGDANSSAVGETRDQRQKKFAQELQDQIKARDEARVKE